MKISERQRKLRRKRRAEGTCLTCGGPRLSKRKYCKTCLRKDKHRKNEKSQDLIRRGCCPWCGDKVCITAWAAHPFLSGESNRLRKTCIKKWAAGIPDRLSPRLRKLWIQHHGPENLLKKYGWPGVLDEITDELLFFLTPPTKAAIRRAVKQLEKLEEQQRPFPNVLDAFFEALKELSRIRRFRLPREGIGTNNWD